MTEKKEVSVLRQNVTNFISFKYKELVWKLEAGVRKCARLAIMYQKQKRLAVMSENPSKIYVIEIN